MRWFLFLLLGALLVVPAAGQEPSEVRGNGDYNFNETTGLINIPVARTQAPGTVFAAGSFHDLGRTPRVTRRGQGFEGTPLDSDFFLGNDGSFHLVGSPLSGWELSAMVLHGDFGEWVFGTKVLLARETEDSPSVAVGVQNMLGFDDNIGNRNLEPEHFRHPAVFAVASKALPLGEHRLHLHMGYGTGRFSNRIFYGGEMAFANGLGLVGEYDGWLSSYGVRYTGLDRWRFTVAVQDGGVGLQVGYQLGDGELEGLSEDEKERRREAKGKLPEVSVRSASQPPLLEEPPRSRVQRVRPRRERASPVRVETRPARRVRL